MPLYVKFRLQFLVLIFMTINCTSLAQSKQNLQNQSDPCTASSSSRGTTGLIYDDEFLTHDPGATHPESAARVIAIMQRLRASEIWSRLQSIPATAATDDELALIHTRAYLEYLQSADEDAPVNLDADTVLGVGSLDAARHGAGAAVRAVDSVMSDQTENVFVASRPPGHHAFADKASGFCIFNNVAIAARHAQTTYGIERVLIVDWDVHHGNATQDIFYNDPSVMYFSTHQYPHYPQTGLAEENGAGAGFGTNFNVPLPAGSGGREVLNAYKNVLLPEANSFKPELVLISAGFDSHAGDPLAHFQLTAESFREMTQVVKDIAGRHASGRVVSILEGGYHLDNLAAAVEAHVDQLMMGQDCGQ